MTPEHALLQWERSHHRLSPEHRTSFKAKAEASGLLGYERSIIKEAIAKNKRLEDAARWAAQEEARAIEELRMAENKRQEDAAGSAAEAEAEAEVRKRANDKLFDGPSPPARGTERHRRPGDYDPGPKRFCLACGALEVACRCR
jgi:hypothetical protein